MKSLSICVSAAAVSLIVAALAHCYCPAFAVAFKPLLWPLLPLVFFAKASHAAAVAVAVPFLSAAVNSMPTLPVACSLALWGLAFVAAAFALKRLFALARKTA